MRNAIDLADAYLQSITGVWSRLGIIILALLIGHSLGLGLADGLPHETGFFVRSSRRFGEGTGWPFTLVFDWLSGCETLLGSIYVLLLPACWFFSVWLDWSMTKVAIGMMAVQTWQTYLVNCPDWIFILTEPATRTLKSMPGLYLLATVTAVSLGAGIGWILRRRL